MHNHIKTLRTSANISQEQMANMLGMTRITYTHIESGKREPKPSELQKIADFFETSVEKILDQIKKPSVVLNTTIEHTKLTETILYILSKCAGKANFGKIALNKLLYFIDFNYHEKYHTSLTGAIYIKMPMGPVPKDVDTMIASMQAQRFIESITKQYFGYEQTKYLPLKDPDMSIFSAQELIEIDEVIVKYGDKNGKWLTNFSHGDIPWKATKEIGQEINYGLAHYREGIYSVAESEIDD